MRDPKTIKRARRFRKAPTKTEDLLWQQLRGSKIGNAKFRRQADIGVLIVDFACLQTKLVVEIDGGIHNHPSVHQRDIERDDRLTRQGFRILRFSTVAVESDLGAVLAIIESAVVNSDYIPYSDAPSHAHF